MGFGLLFLGYIATFLMSLNSFGFVFRLTGCAIMLSAFSKLSQYERSFIYVRLSCFCMMLASLCESIMTLSLDYGVFDLGFTGDTAKNICISVFFSAAVILHFFLYRSIYKLSSDVGVEKIKLNSMRFGAFAVIEIVILISALAIWYVSPSIAKYIVMVAMLYPYVIFFLNLLLIYSCYKNICEEGDEEAPRKPSKIPFLNKLFEASEKREQEIFDKTKSYAEKRLSDELEVKKNKKKHKKKRR